MSLHSPVSSPTYDDDDHISLPLGKKGLRSTDKRNQHNAIERQRRETLNGRFLTLANALPSMANVKRPSKNAVVTRALAYVISSQLRERILVEENNALRIEVNQHRQRGGLPPLASPQPLPDTAQEPITTRKKARQSNLGTAEDVYHSMAAGSDDGSSSLHSPPISLHEERRRSSVFEQKPSISPSPLAHPTPAPSSASLPNMHSYLDAVKDEPLASPPARQGGSFGSYMVPPTQLYSPYSVQPFSAAPLSYSGSYEHTNGVYLNYILPSLSPQQYAASAHLQHAHYQQSLLLPTNSTTPSSALMHSTMLNHCGSSSSQSPRTFGDFAMELPDHAELPFDFGAPAMTENYAFLA